MEHSKSQPVTKRMVWNAWRQVRSKRGSAGVDGVFVHHFEEKQSANLYKLWNRLASGSYFPPPVLEVLIPKKAGGSRKLGIPTVGDRIAQGVVKTYFEPSVDLVFHPNSYGYRPGRSAHDAVGTARKNCFRNDWVIDLDIKGFFDNLDHDLLMHAVKKHTDEKWVLMYIRRWLEAPIVTKDGKLIKRTKGTPQGGVISPLLANIFLHHAFDVWMEKEFPGFEFERYADDIIVHCKTHYQAKHILEMIQQRLRRCKLEVHPAKTRIVYCKDAGRSRSFDLVSFTFLGFTFQPRKTMNRRGEIFTSFLPGMSRSAKREFGQRLRKLGIQRRSESPIERHAKDINRIVLGYVNYFGKFRKKELYPLLRRLNIRLIKWAQWKFKSLRTSKRRAFKWLKRKYASNPNLFVHWQMGIKP